ncbi:hypothetical protein ACVW0Y_002683 [Pseudomonas sp. TE3786]
MSKISEFKALEAQLAAQIKQLETLKNDTRLKKEIEFETKLRDLMKTYDIGLRGIIALMDPEASSKSLGAGTTQRKARETKIYKNPNTGEVVETKGGNHKVLKAWKAEFGSDVVESWLK